MTDKTEGAPGELSQDEKRREILNDARVRGSTYSQFAESEADTPRGRFDAHERSTMIGSEPIVRYPEGPAWCHDPTGVEPPLGLDVNAQQPTGEAFEVERSIKQLGDAVAAPSGCISQPDVETSASPAPSEKLED